MQPIRATARLSGMMNQLRIAAGLALAAFLASGCATAAPAQPLAISRGVAARVPAADPRPYGAGDTAFGLGLLAAWCRANPVANLVLSPSSLASGLGMAYLGARGGTAQAMARVLHLPAAGPAALAAGLAARSAALRQLDRPGVTLASSDQVWADPSVRTRASYLNAVATGYRAGLARVPMLTNPDQAAQQINQAIARATRGQIPRLLSGQSLRDIGWVLTDALYLRAAWATPFQPGDTHPGTFRTASGQQVSVKFMHGGAYRTVQAARWTAAALPYRGRNLSMLALLPPPAAHGCPVPSASALREITTGLTAGSTAGTPAGRQRGTAFVALPRVSLSSRSSMKSLLGQLGMKAAFGPTADFTGLSVQAGHIGLVEQAATLHVGEKGTVASAATAVGVTPTAARVSAAAQIMFDRPYLLLVTATGTGEPLFLARVANPAVS
jgi:serine protease inhibitor